MEQLFYTMKVPSSITVATVTAEYEVRVGDAENGRMSPSSLSMSQTLCAALDSSKVFTLWNLRVVNQMEKFLPPTLYLVASQVECPHVVRHQNLKWTVYMSGLICPSLHCAILSSSFMQKPPKINKGELSSSLDANPSLPPSHKIHNP